MQVAHALGGVARGAFGGLGGLRGGVIDDDRVWREAGAERGDDFLDRGIVLQDEVHAVGIAHGVGGSGRDDGTEARERVGLARGAVPDSDGVAARAGGFNKGGAEEAGAEECDAGHWELSADGSAFDARAAREGHSQLNAGGAIL